MRSVELESLGVPEFICNVERVADNAVTGEQIYAIGIRSRGLNRRGFRESHYRPALRTGIDNHHVP
jgi:hypothetical protein